MANFVFFKGKTDNLGPIDFQLGLPLDIKGNDKQHKFEIHISKNGAKMDNFWRKIDQDAICALTLNWYNSAIFYSIFMFEYTKLTNLARQSECR